ncbi:NAD(P)-dependent alcohol dehydrogenase [Georgenia sp. AZ-5]|uniref:NAD(P)-dependent alcohol dehydrogenase n=1 Tax=Georgenia sp. AZ-5 TaxID=3367526 RepID=UPI003754F3C8
MAPEKSATTGTPDGRAAAAGTMRAAVREEYGSADVVRLARVARPEPRDDEVLVHVHAAGLDRGVLHMMTGLPYLGRLAFGVPRPKNPVLGMDLAGTVVAVGPRVTRFGVGDEVYGAGKGSFAEYAVAREKQLARKPANLSFTQAAAVPVSGSTALQALTDAGRVRPGQTVLVVGAGGGVGSYAVQLAKALGAAVTGVASTGKLELVRSLGAEAIDYTREDFTDGSRHWDLILDIAGNRPISKLRRALTPAGTVVLTGGEDGDRLTGGMGRQLAAVVLSMFVRQRFTFFLGLARADRLERLTELIEAGKVTPSLDTTYPLDQVPEALRALEAGQVRGKVAITL